MSQDDERSRGWQPARPFEKQRNLRVSGYGPSRHPSGRPAQLWREGYAAGFRDALRLGERELPPETWAVLYQLATRYDLAGAA